MTKTSSTGDSKVTKMLTVSTQSEPFAREASLRDLKKASKRLPREPSSRSEKGKR
jgi:hypothetical protein